MNRAATRLSPAIAGAPRAPVCCEAPGVAAIVKRTLTQDYRRIGEAKPLVVYDPNQAVR